MARQQSGGGGAAAAGSVTNATVANNAAIDATKIADGSVTSAEFQRLDATSSVQTQLDAKVGYVTLSWTPTGTWSTNTTYTSKIIVENSTYMRGTVKVAVSGVPDNTEFKLNMPSGWELDSQHGNTYQIVVDAYVNDVSVPNAWQIVGCKTSATVIEFYTVSVNPVGSALVIQNPINRTMPMTWANGDYMIINFGVHVVAV